MGLVVVVDKINNLINSRANLVPLDNQKNMFSSINELVSKLSLEDSTNYNQCKKARKLLQEIKVEAQNLRNKITTNFNSSKKGKAVDKVVGVVENVVEEEKLVDENSDDFFDKQ